MRPEVTIENERVIDVWYFCGGWNPERLALAVAYYDVKDVDFLIGQLIAMNDAVRAHKAAQQR